MFGGALLREAVALAARSIGRAGWIGVGASARFLRPLTPGPATADVEILHRGSRTAVVEVRIAALQRLGLVVVATLAPAGSLPTAAQGEPECLPPAARALDHDAAAVAARVDWRIEGDWGPSDGRLRGWVASRYGTGPAPADFAFVAADLLTPALPGARRDEPIRIASLSLEVAVLARPRSHWSRQDIVAERVGADGAHAAVRLSAPDGTTIARALHRAVLLPATRQEMPFSAAAFGWGTDEFQL